MADEIAEEINAQISKAVLAIQEFKENKSGKKALFPDTSETIFLAVKYKKPPLRIIGPVQRFITLPCPGRKPENTSKCLILPDFDRSTKAFRDPDVEKQARKWAEILEEKYKIVSGKDYSKIFTFDQLRREFSEMKDRISLVHAYDIFLVDYRLRLKLDNFMPYKFKKSVNRPIAINSNCNFSQQLATAYSKTALLFLPLRDSLVICFGNLNQPVSELEANAKTIVEALLKFCPGGALNIRSCYVQAIRVSLPVFIDFGSANEVKLEEPINEELPEVVDEITTLPDGLAVKVRADGYIKVVEKNSGEEVLYPTGQDEWDRNDDIKPLPAEMVQKIVEKRRNKSKNEGINEKSSNELKETKNKKKKKKRKMEKKLANFKVMKKEEPKIEEKEAEEVKPRRILKSKKRLREEVEEDQAGNGKCDGGGGIEVSKPKKLKMLSARKTSKTKI